MPYVPDVPDPLFGEHLTSISVVKLKKSTTTPGTWEADGSPESILAYINSTDHSHDTGARNVRTVRSQLINMVPRDWGESLDISVLARSEDVNIFHRMWDESTTMRFGVEWQEGDEVCSGRYTGLRKRGGVQVRDENVISWSLGPMNDGSGNKSNVTRIKFEDLP